MTKQLETVDLEALRVCTGGDSRSGLVKDLKTFHSVGGAPWGLPAGTGDRLIEQIYASHGF
jgi:hypothetical protein